MEIQKTSNNIWSISSCASAAHADFYIVEELKNSTHVRCSGSQDNDPSIYARDWADGIEVPLYHILQATVAAMLCNADFLAIAALLVDAHNMDVAIHELPRNPAAEEQDQASRLSLLAGCRKRH